MSTSVEFSKLNMKLDEAVSSQLVDWKVKTQANVYWLTVEAQAVN